MSGWFSFEHANRAAQLLQAQLYMVYSLLLPGTMETAARILAAEKEAGDFHPDLVCWKGIGIVLAFNPWLNGEFDLMVESFMADDRLFLRHTVAREQMVEEWLVELFWRAFETLDAGGTEVTADAAEVAGLLEFQRRAVELLAAVSSTQRT